MINDAKQRPDKQAIAIRTVFEDNTPGAVKAWLSVDSRGMTEYLSESDVDTWTDLYKAPEPESEPT